MLQRLAKSTTGTFDGAPGDNFDEVFAHDGIDGHDVFLGDGGFDEFIGEGGDDIMVGSPGRGKMAGMSGWDWATYKDSTLGVNADLSIPIIFDEAPNIPGNAALDEFQSMEGLSGSAFNDVLKGSNVLAADRPVRVLADPVPEVRGERAGGPSLRVVQPCSRMAVVDQERCALNCNLFRGCMCRGRSHLLRRLARSNQYKTGDAE